MPLSSKGEKILKHMEETYGKEKGEQVFYASKNAGKITGIDAARGPDRPRLMFGWKFIVKNNKGEFGHLWSVEKFILKREASTLQQARDLALEKGKQAFKQSHGGYLPSTPWEVSNGEEQYADNRIDAALDCRGIDAIIDCIAKIDAERLPHGQVVRVWHDKFCPVNIDLRTQSVRAVCRCSKTVREGSPYGEEKKPCAECRRFADVAVLDCITKSVGSDRCIAYDTKAFLDSVTVADAKPEMVAKVLALYNRPGTPGEKAAAAEALRRMGWPVPSEPSMPPKANFSKDGWDFVIVGYDRNVQKSEHRVFIRRSEVATLTSAKELAIGRAKELYRTWFPSKPQNLLWKIESFRERT